MEQSKTYNKPGYDKRASIFVCAVSSHISYDPLPFLHLAVNVGHVA